MTTSLLLQPQQFVYILFLLLARLLPSGDYVFELNSRWYLVELSRVYIMMSRVSVLNLVIGLSRSYYFVVVALVVRAVCSYFQIIMVFLGTEDTYGSYEQTFGIVPLSIWSDASLWCFLILLRLYSHNKTEQFQGSTVTDIFK